MMMLHTAFEKPVDASAGSVCCVTLLVSAA